MRKRTRLALSLCCVLHGICAAHAQTPGRLFFTPEQRKHLEQRPQTPPPVTVPKEESIRFDGMVWRGNRMVSLWINATARQADERYKPDLATGRLIVSTRAGARTSLGAGQHWPPAGGTEAGHELRHDSLSSMQ